MKYRRGESAELVAAWRDAAARGEVEAMLSVARIAARTPDGLDEAESMLRSAVELGDVEAMYRLGSMLWRSGELAEGERFIHRAALGGFQTAISTMGNLCELRGDVGAAEAWFAKITDEE
jgi:TPR repeat protein